MSDPKRCKSMALEVQADLAKESEREAKGVSWDLHQRECDRNEALEYEIETLQAKIADLENELVVSELMRKVKADADAIREAFNYAIEKAKADGYYTIDGDDIINYANKLEAGTL